MTLNSFSSYFPRAGIQACAILFNLKKKKDRRPVLSWPFHCRIVVHRFHKQQNKGLPGTEQHCHTFSALPQGERVRRPDHRNSHRCSVSPASSPKLLLLLTAITLRNHDWRSVGGRLCDNNLRLSWSYPFTDGKIETRREVSGLDPNLSTSCKPKQDDFCFQTTFMSPKSQAWEPCGRFS